MIQPLNHGYVLNPFDWQLNCSSWLSYLELFALLYCPGARLLILLLTLIPPDQPSQSSEQQQPAALLAKRRPVIIAVDGLQTEAASLQRQV